MYTWDKKLAEEAMKWGWKPDTKTQNALSEGKHAKMDKYYQADPSAPVIDDLPLLGSMTLEVGMTRKKTPVAVHAEKGKATGYFIVGGVQRVPFRVSDFVKFLNRYTICRRNDLWKGAGPWVKCKPLNSSQPDNPFLNANDFFVAYINDKNKLEDRVEIGFAWQKMLLGVVPNRTYTVREIGTATSPISVEVLRTKNTFGSKTNVDMKDWVKMVLSAL